MKVDVCHAHIRRRPYRKHLPTYWVINRPALVGLW
jgi:hypothetical protein